MPVRERTRRRRFEVFIFDRWAESFQVLIETAYFAWLPKLLYIFTGSHKLRRERAQVRQNVVADFTRRKGEKDRICMQKSEAWKYLSALILISHR
jgi:hypothetical protein